VSSAFGLVYVVTATHLFCSLEGNRVEEEGGTAIADALVANDSLEQLSLKENFIGRVGCEALAVALEVNNSLTRLE